MHLVSTYLAFGIALTLANPASFSITFEGPFEAEAGGVHNIHISYEHKHDGEISMHYGSCLAAAATDCHHHVGSTHVGRHPLAGKHNRISTDQRPVRYVWLPPQDTPDGGCLHAFSEGLLVGRSQPIRITRRKSRRQTIPIAEIADAEGPWFDGVEHLSAKEPGTAFVSQAKSKSIGILGGGMSGLMTSLLLESVGIHDWKILEASQRVGGRVHTSYLNGTTPDQYQYQEMGPMRFPVSITDADTNETIQIQDMRLVFQLADHMNMLNNNDPTYKVNFIPWIQASQNQPVPTPKRRFDGTIPGAAEVKANPSLASNVTASYSNATAVEAAETAYDNRVGLNKTQMAAFGRNVFKAHKWAVDRGLFDFSEAGYIRYVLHNTWNITDEADSLSDVDPSWPYETVYFDATTWRTIDQGLSRLPHSFEPHILNRTLFGVSVSEMSWDPETEKMTVGYRPGSPFDPNTTKMSFDYTVVAVPFTKVRLWRLPAFTSLMSRAIGTLNYEQSCKVALHYKSRFWEHLEHPIIGGCGSVNIPGIGSVCFPSYKLNASMPGVILASYQSGVPARSLGAMTEEQHVAYVQRAMVETLGPLAESEWTGNYDRICWENNEYQAGAWAAPTLAQQPLYLQAFFRTEMNTVFVGEHTSYTHAWIFSALESAVRGTTQLLLDMGLVDEAKNITGTWMARWISV